MPGRERWKKKAPASTLTPQYRFLFHLWLQEHYVMDEYLNADDFRKRIMEATFLRGATQE